MAVDKTPKIVLSEAEASLLREISDKVGEGSVLTVEQIAALAGIDKSTAEALVRLLASKNIVAVREQEEKRYRLTDEGRRYLLEGLPEEKLVSLLEKNNGLLKVEEARAILGELFEKALANAARKKLVRIDRGVIRLLRGVKGDKESEALKAVATGRLVDEEVLKVLKRRRLVEEERVKKTIVIFKKSPRDVLAEAVISLGALTRDHIKTGAWKKHVFREYDVGAEPPRITPNRLHFFREFIEYIRDIMKEMGFKEVETGVVELEFWNYDVLFQPQYHPARNPSDTFYLANPRRGRVDERHAKLVEYIHKTKLGYKWRLEDSLRLILRSHTTATSVRMLYELKPKPPFRLFTIGRVYRVESIDARHLLEFHQLDGIAAESGGITFSELIGLISEFFERIGIEEYKFRPAYFPFTEPSAEASVKIAGQWIEVLGCGMFRPEVLEAVGIEYPVAAWGMGLERIAMALYNISDIRRLYSLDLSEILNVPYRWWMYAGSVV